MLIRIRSREGLDRIQVQPTDPVSVLLEKFVRIRSNAEPSSVTVSTQPKGNEVNLANIQEKLISFFNLRHGDLLYASFTDKSASQQPTQESENGINPHVDTTNLHTNSPQQGSRPWEMIKQDEVDDLLENQDGMIKRERSPRCTHGPTGVCEKCMALEPFDPVYMEEHKIKHLSFHAYLRKLNATAGKKSNIKQSFIPPLDPPDYRVKQNCDRGHAPWPEGICSRCQPAAITLQSQQFRTVDHVEFSQPALIDNFINFWRATGTQRFGYLYGKYVPYTEVPLGVKAVIEAIYEPPQQGDIDGITLGLPWENEAAVNDMAAMCGLQQVGVIYTDLVDDGTGQGTVLCKRHSDSYFLSSQEICFAGEMQRRHPNPSRFSSTGYFASKFVTCVVSGNTDGHIDVQAYQVSNSALAMIEADIIEPSIEPGIMRIKEETGTRFVPEITYRYKNKYNIDVQENAKPCFPVEYLLVTLTHGFPSSPNPLFVAKTPFPTENRLGLQTQDLQAVAKLIGNEMDLLENISDFHLVAFIALQGILTRDTLASLAKAATSHTTDDIYVLAENLNWQTFMTIVRESRASHEPNRGSGLGSAVEPILGQALSRSTSRDGGMDLSGTETSRSEKACPHCTFVNSSSNSSCEMCGLPLD